jgi:4-hydroxybenzoate polyprenyltransferase
MIIKAKQETLTEMKANLHRDSSTSGSNYLPLCVDLDGTFVKTDTLVESVLLHFKKKPLEILKYAQWILKGKSFFKQKIADRVDLKIETLPRNEQFTKFLIDEKRKGRTIVLSTASNQKTAKRIKTHFDLFDDIIASDQSRNLQGKFKRRALVDRYGEFMFDYAGNSRQDLEVWPHARNAIVVNPSVSIRNKVKNLPNVTDVFEDRPGLFKSSISAIRTRQWPKNLLVFVPLIVSQKIFDPQLIFLSFLAFFCFCLCASSLYVINDLLDIPADRQHPTKSSRPFAAGDLSLVFGLVVSLCLLTMVLLFALLLPASFIYYIVFYGSVSFLYSMFLKSFPIIDVLILSGLYTLRILAGGIATFIPISFWLLSFSMFIFLSLAILKRYTELLPICGKGYEKKITGRGYWTNDIDMLRILGVSSGCLSVLVMALYINSEQVSLLYDQPTLLWVICPLLLFWVCRIWLLAGRGQMDDDPVLFAIKDPGSLVVGILTVLFGFLAV